MFLKNASSRTRTIAKWGRVGLQIIGLLATILGSATYLLLYLLLVTRAKLFLYKIGFRITLIARGVPRRLRKELVEMYNEEIEKHLAFLRVRDLLRVLGSLKTSYKWYKVEKHQRGRQ